MCINLTLVGGIVAFTTNFIQVYYSHFSEGCYVLYHPLYPGVLVLYWLGIVWPLPSTLHMCINLTLVGGIVAFTTNFIQVYYSHFCEGCYGLYHQRYTGLLVMFLLKVLMPLAPR